MVQLLVVAHENAAIMCIVVLGRYALSMPIHEQNKKNRTQTEVISIKDKVGCDQNYYNIARSSQHNKVAQNETLIDT